MAPPTPPILIVFTALAFMALVLLGLLDECLQWLARRRRARAADQARMRASAKTYHERRGDLITVDERLRQIDQGRPRW